MAKRKLWTTAEDTFLRMCYAEPGNSVKFISERLGRTEQAVTSRAAYLHLNKIPYYMTNMLTPREEEVYQLLLTELTDDEIAQKLRVTRRTVESHTQKIFEKNYVESRQELKEKFYEGKINTIDK